MRLIPLTLALALAFTSLSSRSATASQQPTHSTLKQEISAFKSACQSDMDKLCSDIKPGNGRVVACLHSKEEQLSPDCTQSLNDLHARVSARVDKAEMALRKSCGNDVQKFCSEVPSGEGRVMDCLTQHETQLSGSCKSFQSKMQKKIEKFMS